jgi:hypothetical protein
VQYDQQYNLTPQTAGFLSAHGIDYRDFLGVNGTPLQHHVHSEICDLVSQAATAHMQFSNQKNLLTSVVEVAHAAHQANKNNQVRLASQLTDVGWIGFKLNREIINSIINDPMAYAKAGVSGIKNGVKGVLYTATHLGETINGLGKAIYSVLEFVAFNSSEMVLEYPEIYGPRRDKINAQAAAVLKNLGEKIENSTGPERFEALVQFAVDYKSAEKIIHAVGGVCGIVRSQAKVMRSLEGIASLAEEQAVAREVMQAAEQLELVVQEKVAKSLAGELMEAGKNLGKTGKVASGSKATPPRTAADKMRSALKDAQRVEERTKTLPDGRIRYYEKIKPSDTPGPTRGRSYVTEFDSKTGRVRQWTECYDHAGNVNRVRPKMINGRTVVSQHYPATYLDIQNNIKGSKWHIPEKTSV